jgi:hypothetical protein
MRSICLGACLFCVLGGVAGGFLGDLAFGWILRQGFYALALPGAGIGIGCGLLSRRPSLLRGIICGVAAIPLGLYSEWRRFPLENDGSWGYFLAHALDLKPVTLGFIALGALLAFWFGKGYLGGYGPANPGGGGTDPTKQPPQ